MSNWIKNTLKKSELIVNSYDQLRQTYYKYCISDVDLIKKKFKKRMEREVNLENPKAFNDKIQWLKLNWYDPLATKCADKYEVRKFVADRIGEEYLNELYAVYESVDEIDIDKLPKSFVLKGTHGSGFNIICKDKYEMDWNAEFKKMRRWLRTNYYWQNCEWVYKDIKPRIICEKYIETEDGSPLKDYKFFCFDGEPKFLFIATDRGIDTKFDFYDLDWNKIPVSQYYPTSNYVIDKPSNFDEMLECARLLSKGFPHVRVDFYLNKSNIIFGELTFFHFSGMRKFEPAKYDEIFGDYLKLPTKNKL